MSMFCWQLPITREFVAHGMLKRVKEFKNKALYHSVYAVPDPRTLGLGPWSLR